MSKRPWELLPLPKPADFDPSEGDPSYFYHSFLKHFIPDTIEMMNTGLHLDSKAVGSLRNTVDKVLKKVDKRLGRNPLIKRYQEERAKKLQKIHKAKCTEKVRKLSYYVEPYKESNIQHRTWVVNEFLKTRSLNNYVKDKWTVKDLKDLNIFLEDPFIFEVIRKEVTDKSSTVKAGMRSLAEYKLELWNRPRYDKANTTVTVPDFNPGSAIQSQELFALLKIEPLAFSKDTGNPSWGRDQIEELLRMSEDKDLTSLLEAMIDHSYGGIIKTTFLAAFDKFTIDGVLHGNIRLFGAKSMRNTSNSPNLLNMPSTGSIYAKPLKKCFIAPEGYIVYAIDFNGLEDRGIANLSGDKNKIAVFSENLDGHALAATYYFRSRLVALIGEYKDNKEASKLLKDLVNADNPIAEAIRQDSKPVSFGLAYGAFPPKVAESIKCALEEAERIFDVYHNELFPGITEYREEYVLKTAKKQGYLHLGLGCRIYTDNPEKEIRSISNATCQFWSVLTQIAINELNYRSTNEGIKDAVNVHATIYDSVYVYVKKNAKTVKWVNDNLIEIMRKDFMEDQIVPNDAVGEIGNSWGSLTKIPQDATLEQIEELLTKI